MPIQTSINKSNDTLNESSNFHKCPLCKEVKNKRQALRIFVRRLGRVTLVCQKCYFKKDFNKEA